MMKALDRIIVTVAALVLLFVGGIIVTLVAGWNGMPFIADLVSAARETARVEAGLLGLLGIAIGLYMFAFAWQREEGADDIELESEGGSIRIALKAVEAIIFEAAADIDGVEEVSAQLASREDELIVDVAVQVQSERPMPDVARDVQERVGARIHAVAGVPVARLDVHVRGVNKPRRHRVE